MIEKHMKQVLRRKIDEWANSIEDKEIREIVRKKTIVTGGAIVSMIQNEKPKDYDIYLEDYESCLKVANYYANKFNSSDKNGKKVSVITSDDTYMLLDDRDVEGELVYDQIHSVARILEKSDKVDGKRVYLLVKSSGVTGELPDNEEQLEIRSFEDVYDTSIVEETEEEIEKYVAKYISPNAITLSDKIQVVIRFYGEPSKIHETYDYIHTKGYYYKNELTIPREVYEAVANHVLIYTGSRYPVASIVRSRKFIKRGWTINAGQYLKMCYQISKLDLADIDTLNDQLVGVDSAYFTRLIECLRGSEEEDISITYMMNIIDRIF